MNSNSVPLKIRRVDELICVKSVEAQTSSRWCSVEAQVSSSSLDHGSELRGLSPKTDEDDTWAGTQLSETGN
ncbi:hypothetical protein TNCV_1040471 [Trichonephila clavipes]|nr:hypothetical protein TNCV_1040471 [Trichonephila clavipes]